MSEGRTGTGPDPRSANTWPIAILTLICAYGGAFGVLVLGGSWNPVLSFGLACLAFMAALIVTLIVLVGMGYDLD